MRSGEIMVVLIVLIFAVSRVVQARYGDRRGRRGALPMAHDAGETERLRGELRQLRERVQVLEAIVTDGDRHRAQALEQEIERLRDRRVAGRQEAE